MTKLIPIFAAAAVAAVSNAFEVKGFKAPEMLRKICAERGIVVRR